MSVLIRPVTLGDTPRLVEIYDYYVTHTAVSFEYETPSLAEFENRIRQISAEYPYLVVETDGKVQGYAYAHAFIPRKAYQFCCELTIYLDKSARHQGLGRALYTALEEELRQRGFRNLYACIGVPLGDDPHLSMDSPKFHERLGFTLAGTFRKSGWKFGRWYDMIWMEKLINQEVKSP